MKGIASVFISLCAFFPLRAFAEKTAVDPEPKSGKSQKAPPFVFSARVTPLAVFGAAPYVAAEYALDHRYALGTGFFYGKTKTSGGYVDRTDMGIRAEEYAFDVHALIPFRAAAMTDAFLAVPMLAFEYHSEAQLYETGTEYPLKETAAKATYFALAPGVLLGWGWYWDLGLNLHLLAGGKYPIRFAVDETRGADGQTFEQALELGGKKVSDMYRLNRYLRLQFTVGFSI